MAAKKKSKLKTLPSEALEFFKYNPSTHGDQTFNIDKALNENWDKVKGELVRQETEIEAVKEQVENIDVSWDGITGKPEAFPANGGNADTLDGKHASDFLPTKTSRKGLTINPTSYENGIWDVEGELSTSNGHPITGFRHITYFVHGQTSGVNGYRVIIAVVNNDFKTFIKIQSWDGWSDWKNISDADTLDGKHASEFAPAGFGLGTTCVNVTDWNNISSNGYYMGSNATNAPNTDWWVGYTIVHNANWVVQVVNNFNNTRQWKQRFKSNGVWTTWEDFGGGGVKSVQRGVVASVSNSGTLDITISPVNINKASANLPFTAGIASSSGGECYIGLQLINSTTLRLHHSTTKSVTHITWEVIEYN